MGVGVATLSQVIVLQLTTNPHEGHMRPLDGGPPCCPHAALPQYPGATISCLPQWLQLPHTKPARRWRA